MSVRGLLSATVAALLLTGCSDAFSPESVSGFYDLVSIEGESLPTTSTTYYGALPITATFSAGSITLNENSTFGLSFDVTFVWIGEEMSTTITDAGTFTLVEPSTIQFTGNETGEFGGTLDGDRLTVISGGDSMVFER